MLGALVAGGASLLSGLLGRSSAKKQAQEEKDAIRKANDQATAMAAQMNKEVRARADAASLVPVATEREHSEIGTSRSSTRGGVDMAGFMAAAENNGFNPLTFLRSGALSLFATSDTETMSTVDYEDWTCTTGERAMDAALAGQYIPQLSPVISQTRVPGVGEVFGNAIQSGANQYLQDLSQQENNAFQMDLLNARLKGQSLPGSFQGSRSFYVPYAQQTGGAKVTTGPEGTINNPMPLSIWGLTDDGRKVRIPNPDLPDSEQIVIPPMYTPPKEGYLTDRTPYDTWMRLRKDLWNSVPSEWIDSQGNLIYGQ